MKFISEKDVPEGVRMLAPLPRKTKDPLVEILERLTLALSKDPVRPDPVDLSPLVQVLADRPPFPNPSKKWEFTFHRNAKGLIDSVVAERLE